MQALLPFGFETITGRYRVKISAMRNTAVAGVETAINFWGKNERALDNF